MEELTRADRRLGAAEASLARSERLATVGRLAAGLAHEIGNPLGAISGYVEIARARLPAGADPDLADAVVRIDEAAARIDRTSATSSTSPGPSPPRLVAGGPRAALVEATVRLARVQSRFSGWRSSVAVPEALPAAWADEHQLGQVLLNLLLNAGDAMGGAGAGDASRPRPRGRRSSSPWPTPGPGIAAARPAAPLRALLHHQGRRGRGPGSAWPSRCASSSRWAGRLSAENGPGGGAVFTVRLPGGRGGRAAGDPAC